MQKAGRKLIDWVSGSTVRAESFPAPHRACGTNTPSVSRFLRPVQNRAVRWLKVLQSLDSVFSCSVATNFNVRLPNHL
jgi:hypothetical protein